MEIIAKLGSLMGLSFICGVNLYATVAVVGLCLKHGLVQGLPPELSVLANDAVIAVALFLYVVEFVIDKIQGLDTLWDTLHTIIRPLGGALMAVLQAGEGSPALEVIAFMIGASLASAAHLTKAGTRLLVQASPEPFSNMALSVGEDVFAVAYSYLSLAYPRWTFFCTLVLAAAVAVFLPFLFRAVSMGMRALGHRLVSAFGTRSFESPVMAMTCAVESAYDTVREDGEEILWAGKAFAVRLPGVPRYAAVHMILSDRAVTVFFHRFFQGRLKRLYRADVTRAVVYPGKLLAVCAFYNAGTPWTVGVYRALARTLPARWFSRNVS
ncbi:DUF4126 domain-containing protein [Desulfosoma sp.]